jgi:hypothetical protein
MTESETEAEIMDRLEVALRRIASAAHAPRRAAVPVANGDGIDRVALIHTLDTLIARLRAGLKPASAHHHIPE